MAGLVQAAVRNPQQLGAVIGAVIGLIVGLLVDEIVFHAAVRGLVFGFVIGGVIGWWQHKPIAGFATKYLLERISPL